jgi:hypothetical protein
LFESKARGGGVTFYKYIVMSQLYETKLYCYEFNTLTSLKVVYNIANYTHKYLDNVTSPSLPFPVSVPFIKLFSKYVEGSCCFPERKWRENKNVFFTLTWGFDLGGQWYKNGHS